MPAHGLLSCSIELGETNLRLREYGTTYGNKTAETYVAIPSQSTPFGIRFNTHGYIAPGLAIFVFIDGVYQTNRNKRGLKQPTIENPTAANFQVRLGQKEDLLRDGRVIARGWWFEKLNIVPVDTKATVNDDVLNNIGTIEVVVLRCQDDPKNMLVNPFDFPKLPVLTKPAPVMSNSNSRKDRKAESKKTKAKETSDQGDDEGGFGLGLLDGAADAPTGLDGHYDDRTSRSRRDEGRSHRYDGRQRRHASPRRSISNRHRIEDEDDDPSATTSTDDEHMRQKSVRFESPIATSSRGRPSDRYHSPSGSHRSQRGSREIHRHLLRSIRRSPDRASVRDGRPDRRVSRTEHDTRRRSSSADLFRYLADGHDEHARSRHIDPNVSRSRRRSGNDDPVQYVVDDYNERRRGRHRRGSSVERSRSRSSIRERRRSRSSDRREKERREEERRDSDAREAVAKLVGGSDRSRWKSNPCPRVAESSDEHLEDESSSPQGPSRGHATSPNLSQAEPKYSRPTQPAPSQALQQPSAQSFFGTPMQHAPPQSYPAPFPQGFQQATVNYAAQNHILDPRPNAAAQQYGLGPVSAAHGQRMQQAPLHQDQFAGQYEFQGQIAPGQYGGSMRNSLYSQPQNHGQFQGYPPNQIYEFPERQFHGIPQDIPPGLQHGRCPQQPYRNTSGAYDPRDHPSSRYDSPQTHGKGSAPSKPPVPEAPAKESEHSIITVIKQLQELGVINLPGLQDKNSQKKEPPCPMHGDRHVNPNCPKHFVDPLNRMLGEWLTQTKTDGSMPQILQQQVAQQYACNCAAGPKPLPGNFDECLCPKGGGNQGSGSQNQGEKKPDGWDVDKKGSDDAFSSDKKDSNEQSKDAWNSGGGGGTTWDTSGQGQQSTSWEAPNPTNTVTQTPGRGNNAGGTGQPSTEGEKKSENSSNKSQDGDGWNQPDNNNNWNNEDSGTKEKNGSSKSKSKKPIADKAAPVHQKPYTRSYWKGSDAMADSANSGKKREQQYTMPEDPIYTLSESKAKEFNVKHQVRGGKGLEEKKKTYKPLYWDNFNEPYAVFRFKYRSRDMLKKILGEDIKESLEEFQEWLSALSKEQLIAEMLRKKESGAWKSDDGSCDESNAGSKKGKQEQVKDENAGQSWDTPNTSGDAVADASVGWNQGPTGATPATNGGSWETAAATPATTGWDTSGNNGAKPTDETKRKVPVPVW